MNAGNMYNSKHISKVGVQKSFTNKGNECLYISGFKYTKHYTTRYNEVTWRCTRKECRGQVKTDSEGNVITWIRSHDHPGFAQNKVEKEIFRSKCKIKATAELETAPQIILAEHIGEVEGQNLRSTDVQNVRQAMYRARRRKNQTKSSENYVAGSKADEEDLGVSGPQSQQSVEQESPPPAVVVKTEPEDEATVSTQTVVPVQSVQPLPTASAVSHTVTSPATYSASDDTASSQRSETNSPATLAQSHPSIQLMSQHAQPVIASSLMASPKVIVKQDQFHIHMLEAMNDYRKQDTLCDLTLITNDNEHFNVHKIVLISASPYFSSLQEHNVLRDTHSLLDISADTLASLLDYMYGQGLTLCSESVSLIMAASYKLGIHGAIKLCEDYKSKFPTPANVNVETNSTNSSRTNSAHPVLLNVTNSGGKPTLVNVMQKNRRLRKSTPYQSYAAAIRRLRADNNQSSAQVALSQANQQQSQISLLRKELQVNRHHNLRPKKYVRKKSMDEYQSNESDHETEDLSLQIHSVETLQNKNSDILMKGKPGIGGRHRREWRDAINKSQDQQDVSQDQDALQVEVQIKEEPDDE